MPSTLSMEALRAKWEKCSDLNHFLSCVYDLQAGEKKTFLNCTYLLHVCSEQGIASILQPYSWPINLKRNHFIAFLQLTKYVDTRKQSNIHVTSLLLLLTT